MSRSLLYSMCLFVAATSPVWAQLTAEDIDALRQQAQDEGWTFSVGYTPACDYSMEQLTGLVVPQNWRETARFRDFPSGRGLLEAFDWRQQATMPPVRNQGGCGSCWAFATVGPLECNVAFQDNEVVDLSEQYLVSCNSEGWDCEWGGWLAHHYHMTATDPCDSTGAVYEADFPYAAADLPCNCPYPRAYTLADWGFVGPEWGVPSIEAMKYAIYHYGPISACLSVNDAWSGYTGGIFNNCTSGDINHCVTLMGWDDNQGSNGIWILRNSWGAGWGEGGYMRIEYTCCQIGYQAAFVDYWGKASFVADTTFGWLPLPVAFTHTGSVAVDTYTWDFGDGATSHEASPVHEYDEPGMHTVTLEVTSGGDSYSRTRNDYVIVVCDTLKGDSVAAFAGSQVEVTLSARNSVPTESIRIPIEYAGDFILSPVSYTAEGCRTEAFDNIEFTHWDPYNKRYTLTLRCGEAAPLPPGYGPVLKLQFSVSGSAQPGQTVPVVLDGYDEYEPRFSSIHAVYLLPTVAGLITVESSGCCVGDRGNVDGDGEDLVNIVDVTHLAAYLFGDGPAPPCLDEADVAVDGVANIVDLTYLVAYLFGGGPAPGPC